MKYAGMPMGMWALFAGSFQRAADGVVFGYDEAAAKEITDKRQSRKYKEIIAGLPEFEKADRFKMNDRQLRDARRVRAYHAASARRWSR